ncbi:glycosyltransferase [Bdellovibrio sp. HCB288]|uniref:glycosyltransferase n=1 Tax=Bdellovibrio sp. HCB288 TaxID=3394355 RepID=UPI0039B3D4B9
MTSDKLLRNRDLIVFGEDFARHPHSLEHLLRPLFKQNRFIWIETIGLRSPKFNLYDLKRVVGKIAGWLGPKQVQPQREIPANITVVSPFMIPFNQFALIRAFNRWSVARSVRKCIQELGFQNIITVTSVPNSSDYVGDFNETLKVYICVDEFSLWPGLDYEMVRKMEEKLLSKCDVVFATSQALTESKSNGASKTVLLTHGVEFDHFNIGGKQKTEKLKICYYGLFDERSDQQLLIDLAKALPEASLEIIGNVVCDITRLKDEKNIHFLGLVSYAELPKAIKDMDVFILPYVRNELTDNLNPLKLKEYLSTGRPVIATALPEVVKLQDYLFVGKDGAEFAAIVNGLEAASLQPKGSQALQYLQASETWEAKAELFTKVLSDHELQQQQR